MQFTRHILAATIASFLLMLLPQLSFAQCQPAFTRGPDAIRGTNGLVSAVVALPNGDFIIGGAFSTAGGIPAASIARYSAATSQFSPLGSGINGEVNALALLPNGSIAVAGAFTSAGQLTARNVARFDPATNTWSSMNSPFNATGAVLCLAVLPGGDLIAGGTFTTPGRRVVRYNASVGTWSAFGSVGATGPGGVGNAVNALAVTPAGQLVVGGTFAIAGGVTASNLARYNFSTSTWSAPPNGPDDAVLALAALNETDIVVAGSFTSVSGSSMLRIALCYSPFSFWLQIGAGANDAVNSITLLSGSELLIGGNFTIAGGNTVNHIARCDVNTGSFTPLTTGVATASGASAVLATARLSNGDYLAGGEFQYAGGGYANRIASFRPATSNWTGYGSAIDHEIRAIVDLPSGDTLIAGFFTTASGAPSNGICRYNRATGALTAAGLGTNDDVYAMIEAGNDDIIIGGVFTMAGGVASSGVALFHPSTNTYESLGAGVTAGSNYGVLALAFDHLGHLAVGGYFPTAGGNPASNLALFNWQNRTWIPNVRGPAGPVRALYPILNNLLVGGNFAGDFANGISPNFARYYPNTNSWMPADNGLNSTVHAIGDGNDDWLIVGTDSGVFRYSWADPQFASIGSGVNGPVYAIYETYPNAVAIGGNFSIAGGLPARSIAKFDKNTYAWSAFSSALGGTSPTVRALAYTRRGDLAVGGLFSTANNLPAANFTTWHDFSQPYFTNSSMSVRACRELFGDFFIDAYGTGTLSYQWQLFTGSIYEDIGIIPRNFPCAQGGTVTAIASPANSPAVNIRITGCITRDSWPLRCVITDSCGSNSNFQTYLYICRADFNCDQVVDFFDYLDFVQAFSSQAPDADFNHDSVIDFFDYLDFVQAFSHNC